MAHSLHHLECTLAIFQQSGPRLSSSYMHSTNFCKNWPQFYIISLTLQQFFMNLARNNCNLPQSQKNPTPTQTFFGHNGPDFSMTACIFDDFHHSGENYTPTRTIFGHNGLDFSMVTCTGIRIFDKEAYGSNKQPPPLRQYFLKIAHIKIQFKITPHNNQIKSN